MVKTGIMENIIKESMDLAVNNSLEEYRLILKQQLENASISEESKTPLGYFYKVSLAGKGYKMIDANRLVLSNVYGHLTNSQHEKICDIGAIIYVENGLLDTVELHSFGEWPSEFASYKLHIGRVQ